MPPHPPHPHGSGPPHDSGGLRPGPGPVHWLYSAEEKLSLDVVSKILGRFATSLAESGRIRLRDDLEVSPPDPCETMIRFEQTPVGHLILKVELKWGGEGPPAGTGDAVSDLLGSPNGDGHANAEAAASGSENR